MRSRLTPFAALALSFFLILPASAFDAPLSPEAVRDAYFLGQHNNQSTLCFFSQYVKTLSAPDKGPYIAEVEFYTPYTQVVEASRRRTGSYSAQQAEVDYRHHHNQLYVPDRYDSLHQRLKYSLLIIRIVAQLAGSTPFIIYYLTISTDMLY
jgi:hypothetical protein